MGLLSTRSKLLLGSGYSGSAYHADDDNSIINKYIYLNMYIHFIHYIISTNQNTSRWFLPDDTEDPGLRKNKLLVNDRVSYFLDRSSNLMELHFNSRGYQGE